MELDRKLSLNAKEIRKRNLKLKRKNRFAITDDGVWEAMMSHYHNDNYFRQPWSIDGDFDWFVVYHFGQAVDNDKNRVIALTLLVDGKE